MAANQPARALSLLEEAGLLKYFALQEVSKTMGIAKPSPLFFRMILNGIEATAGEAVMVGDRLDHDIFPAQLLRMKMVRVLLDPAPLTRNVTPPRQATRQLCAAQQ